jgi:hypothetical protein
MRRLLASPRRRRRLIWAAGCLLCFVVAAIAIAAVPTGKPLPPVAAPPAEPLESAPADPRQVRLTQAMRRGINATLDRFIPAAVGRRDPMVAWELAGPALRVGSTRRDWRAGNLPVHPFPFRNEPFHGWRPIYTYRDRVGLDLLLQPRRGADVGAIAFTIEVVRRDRRWLVNSVYPAAVWSAPEERPFLTGDQDFTAGGTTAKAVYNAPKVAQSTLNAAWLAVPLGFLGSVLLVPLVFILAAVRRNRRAVAAYKASTEKRPAP